MIAIREALLGDAVELARLRWDFRVADQLAQSKSQFFADFQTWFGRA